jgi:hypothetical protein
MACIDVIKEDINNKIDEILGGYRDTSHSYKEAQVRSKEINDRWTNLSRVERYGDDKAKVDISDAVFEKVANETFDSQVELEGELEEMGISNKQDLSFYNGDQALFDQENDEDETYYQLNTVEALEPAIEELDKYLLDFLKPFGVKSKEFEDLKSKLGVDALGATDVLNKLIWYAKNRNAETVPEEVGHMVTMLMGENNPIMKDLLETITDWSEYEKVYDQYMPLYDNVKQVKIEAVGKLIAISLVKNYKVSGTDKTLLEKALAAIEEFIERLFGKFRNNLLAQMEYSENLADHIAINILMGDKDYIAKLNTSFEKLDYDKALKGNEFAQDIIKTFTDLNGKLTGSLAVAGQGDTIYRSSEEPIHDIDFNVNSIEEYETMLEKVESIKGIPYHYGWDNAQKDYTTYAFLIPKAGYTVEVLERDFNRGNGWVTQYNIRNENGDIVEKTSKNHVAVDFFVYKRGEDKSTSSGIFKTTNDIFKGKLTLATAGNNERLFQREKDQQDYVLSEPTNYNEASPEFTYYQLNEVEQEHPIQIAYKKQLEINDTKPEIVITRNTKAILNKNGTYDLIDPSTNSVMQENMDLETMQIVEPPISLKPYSQKIFDNFVRDTLLNPYTEVMLAERGIDINDIFDELNNIRTEDELSKLMAKILKSIC